MDSTDNNKENNMQLIKINEWLPAEIFSLFFAFGIDTFKGVCGKIRKWRLKKRLEKLIFEEILSRYGNEVYYNDLDHFLSVNRVIYNVVSNAGQSNPYQYKSKSVMVNYYLQKFSEEYPQHLRYYGEIREMLRKYMEVVFQALNEFPNEEAQALGKLMKELTGELSCQLDEVQEGISGINRKLDLLVEQRTPEKTEFFSES